MKILLTGSSGMVGKNVLESKKSDNYFFLTPSSDELNLLDKNAVQKYLKENLPDIVIHCAGKVGGIQANIREPVAFLYENMIMGMNLVKASNDIGITRLINLGSSCMYPKNAENPLKENQVLSGSLEPTNEGYALAKIAVSRLCHYIMKQNAERCYKTLIPCNLYGRHDKFETQNSHLIPAIIAKIDKAILDKKNTVEIWGDGNSRREFMYVSDLVDFIYFSIENIKSIPDSINVGLGYDFSIKDYYSVVSSAMNYSGSFEYNLDKPAGMKQKLTDVEKLKKLGWEAPTSLEDGVKETIEFYKKELKNE